MFSFVREFDDDPGDGAQMIFKEHGQWKRTIALNEVPLIDVIVWQEDVERIGCAIVWANTKEHISYVIYKSEYAAKIMDDATIEVADYLEVWVRNLKDDSGHVPVELHG